jgi:hypothetical protein
MRNGFDLWKADEFHERFFVGGVACHGHMGHFAGEFNCFPSFLNRPESQFSASTRRITDYGKPFYRQRRQ